MWAGGRGDRLGWGHTRKTIQSPKAVYKDPTDYTKPPKDYTKPLNIRQNLNILYTFLKCSTRIATTINLTNNIQYPI